MEDDVSDEILAELILRSLTNACAKLMVSIFETEGNGNSKW